MVLILKELAGFGGYWVCIFLGFIADVVFGFSGKLFANLWQLPQVLREFSLICSSSSLE